MKEKFGFSIKAWQEEQAKFGYSNLVSQEELTRLESLCRKGSEGWVSTKPIKQAVEVINLHLPRFTQIKEYPTRL